MKKKLIGIIFIMLLLVVGSFSTVFAADDFEIGTSNLNNTTENSAKVGDTLLHPEKGWKRYDDTNNVFKYTGNWISYNSNSDWYNSTCHTTFTTGDTTASILFKFTGTKIRIINPKNTDLSNGFCINIDGTTYLYSCNGNLQKPTLVFEKIGLENKIHEVKISLNLPTTYKYIHFDALDIDDTGKLLPYDSINLTANDANSSIVLNWDKVDGATGYNVKRSTTQGSGYETIASNVTGTTYDDKTVQAETAYYYIVTPIINGKEGTPSNEDSAIVSKTQKPTPTDTGNRGLLTVTMTNGQSREYDLSMNEINEFAEWYKNRDKGNGNPYYTFNKNPKAGAFTKRVENLVFDKISQFDIDEYDKK